MQRRQSPKRSILFWVFFLTSIPIAIALMGYASGLRFDKETKTLVESAGISIQTTPENATIAVNGAVLEKKSPLVHSLSPGMYTLTITQENHSTWEKKVTITPGESELFSHIILFGKAAPIEIDTIESKKTFVPTKEKFEGSTIRILDGPFIVAVDDVHEHSFILDSLEEKIPLHHIPSRIKSAMWNKENQLLYATDTEIWIWEEKNHETLLRRQSKTIYDVAWHAKNQHIFFSDLTGIYAMEIDPRDQRQIWKISDVSDAKKLIVPSSGDTLLYESQGKYYSLQLY